MFPHQRIISTEREFINWPYLTTLPYIHLLKCPLYPIYVITHQLKVNSFKCKILRSNFHNAYEELFGPFQRLILPMFTLVIHQLPEIFQ
jgi:hypothetical protein